jgi:DnaK suppressor protein
MAATKTSAARATPAATAPAAPRKVKVLTEEDLLKAPERDYMNEAQLAFFKARLVELRDQLLNNADDTGQHLRENEVTTDPSDRATLEEEYTLELRTRDRERKLLKKVEKSLRLIDDGSYGYCEETGEPIGVARLLARPTATLSLEAQERRERVQKMYGD